VADDDDRPIERVDAAPAVDEVEEPASDDEDANAFT
jgi:hypothetical protein